MSDEMRQKYQNDYDEVCKQLENYERIDNEVCPVDDEKLEDLKIVAAMLEHVLDLPPREKV